MTVVALYQFDTRTHGFEERRILKFKRPAAALLFFHAWNWFHRKDKTKVAAIFFGGAA